jgi:hypothetical protein
MLNERRMPEMHGTCSLFGNVVCAYHAHSRAQMPTHTAGRSLDDRSKLLHIIIVGGGPTGVEVTGELIDLVGTDIKRLYPDLARDIRVTLVEARDILGNFDVRLREYAARHLTRQGVKLVKVGKRRALHWGLLLMCSILTCQTSCSPHTAKMVFCKHSLDVSLWKLTFTALHGML